MHGRLDVRYRLIAQGRSTFSSDGLQMASFRASGAHMPSARCAPGHENPSFSARHLLNVDRPWVPNKILGTAKYRFLDDRRPIPQEGCIRWSNHSRHRIAAFDLCQLAPRDQPLKRTKPR